MGLNNEQALNVVKLAATGMRSDPPSCLWPDQLPFWASIIIHDHGNYTEAEQFRNCQTWAAP
jgi:hypothetical protein